MNIVTLIGRLTKDPEVKFGNNGKACARFTLAITRTLNKEEADFINCVAFGKTAELIGEYLKKGNKLGLVGRLQVGSYEKDGEKRLTTDVIVDYIEFLESKSESSTSNEGKKEISKKSEEIPYEDDDEFPF